MAMIVARKLLLLLMMAIDGSLAWTPQPHVFHVPLPTPTSTGKTTQLSLYPASGPVKVLSGPELVALNKSQGPHAGHPVMVAMYASWCPHCWHLVPKWVKFALAFKDNEDIEVASINCADEANQDACDSAGVTGYPAVQCYGCPESRMCKGEKLKLGYCEVTVGFAIPPGSSIPQWLGEWVHNATDGKIQPTDPDLLDFVEPGDGHVVMEGGPGKAGFPPAFFATAEKRVQDGMRGFLTAIWTKNDREAAFKAVNFLRELFLSEPCCHIGGMPDSYRSEVILNLITLSGKLAGQNVDTREVVAQYAASHGITGLGSQEKFATYHEHTFKMTDHGQDSFHTCQTFTCAIWQFLHFVTTGSAYFAAAGSPRLSPGHVMTFARTFVHEFLTCEKCRHHFLLSYDDCQFDRCEVDQQSDWPGLVLWLWRVHEGVNLRTAAKDNAPVDRRWPSYEDCPGCWKANNFGHQNEANDFDMKDIGKHTDLINAPFNLTKTYNFMVAQYVGWDSTGITAIGGKVMRKWEVEQLLIPPEQAHRSKTLMWSFSAVAVAGIVASFSLWYRVKASQRVSCPSPEDLETLVAEE